MSIHMHYMLFFFFLGNNLTNIYIYIYIVGTEFDLNPEQEWTQAHETRTINL